MKKTMVAMLAWVLAMPAGVALAQGDRVGKKLERMTRELTLTPDQQARVKPILEFEAQRKKALDEEVKARLSKVLTKEQMARMAAKPEPEKAK